MFLVAVIYALIAVAISTLVVGGVKLVVDYITKHKDKIKHNVKMAVAIVICTLVLVLALLIPGAVRGEEAQRDPVWVRATVNGSVEVVYYGKPAYMVIATSNEGEILSYFGSNEVQRGVRIWLYVNQDTYEVENVIECYNVIWAPGN